MNYTEQAIGKAIEGGYDETKTWAYSGDGKGTSLPIVINEKIFLDPSFWQSLGRAGVFGTWRRAKEAEWKDYWHRFIDHLAEGKTAESFFEGILTP